jgi:sRNA-binding regulator protein Hfq
MATPGNSRRVADLEILAGSYFGQLTDAELKLLRSAIQGEIAICGPNPLAKDVSNDPITGKLWGAERQIRAALIRWLCLDRQANEFMDPRGIQVHGARILEDLNLFYANVPFPLTLAGCFLDGELNLRYAQLIGINLQGTCVRTIAADGVQIRSNIFLRYGFRCKGQVRLSAARIGGNLECDGATFVNPARPDDSESGLALIADGAIITGGVFLRNGFSALGEVRLIGSQIGSLDCSNGTFKNPPQQRVQGAGAALSADGMLAHGSVLLRNGFVSEGEVKLLGAQIGGNLDFSGAALSNPLLPGTSLGGDALTADRIVVKAGIFLGNGFRADGEVRLLGAQIDGDLDCQGGTFKAPIREGNRALSAHSVAVNGNVFLRNGFCSNGDVGFSGARIEGNLECTGGAFHGDLNLETASVRGALYWKSIADAERAGLNLMSCSIGTLDDDVPSWPAPGRLLLDGLAYERFSPGSPRDAGSRLDWLARQVFFAPQPYRHLAKTLRSDGNNSGAQRVLFQMEHQRRKLGDRNWAARCWSIFLRVTIGYGYYPTPAAFCWLLGLIVSGLILFSGGYAIGSVAPADKDAYQPFKQASQLPPHYERFDAFTYSLENSFPP